MFLRCFLIGVWLSVCGLAQSQTGYRFSAHTVQEGLSQNTVNAIHVDADGFVWMGTQDGLNRFDGERYEVWPFRTGQEVLGDNFITALAESKNGFLYVGCRNGLFRISPSKASHETIAFPDHQTVSQHRTVGHIAPVDSGAFFMLWAQLYFIHDERSNAEHIDEWSDCVAVVKCHEKTALVLKNKIIELEKGTVSYSEESGREIIGMREHQDGYVVLLEDELVFLDKDFITIQRVPLPVRPTDFLDSEGVLWATTEAGLFTIEHGIMRNVRAVDGPGAELQRDHIRCLAMDQNGGVWIGSTRFGAFRHDLRSQFLVALPGEWLADPIVWAACKVDNQLLVGTTNGLDVFQLKPGWEQAGYDPEPYFRHVQRLDGFHVAGLQYIHDTLWLATRQGTLQCLILKDERWKVLPERSIQIAKAVFHLTASPNDELIVSGGDGASVVTNGRLERKLRWSVRSNHRISDYSHCILADEDGMWISSMTGLHRYSYADSGFAFNGPGFEGSDIRYPYTSAVVKQQDGRLLVGTLGDGWMLMSADGKSVERHISTDSGLPNGVIYGFVETDYGILSSSNAGLSCYSDGALLHLTPTVGLPFDEHSINACGTIDGVPWFGGIDGLYFVHELAFKRYTSVPQPAVTEVLVNYRPVDYAYNSNTFVLNPGDNSLVLGVAVPGVYAVRPKIQYRMAQVADDWVALRTANERIAFTTLPGGEYALEIATNDYRQASGGKTTYAIVVNAPFWESSWFIVGALFILVGITYLVVRIAARRKLQQEILKREAIERVKQERERISMDLHDNIGSQLTHVIASLDNLSARMERGDATSHLYRVEELSSFARGTMNQLRDTIWTLSREEVSLDAFSKRINELASRLLMETESPVFRMETQFDENVVLAPQTAVHLFRVLQEALNNCLKHAAARQVSVRVSALSGAVVLVIEDDGRGFNIQQDAESGYGLRNMKRRIEEIGGLFEIESTPGKGTRITIQLAKS